ncbi:MAG TPA: hypothetical protein VMU72_08275 [Gaiellaceae bacterium]|nr:hypothetical protein [Gaiellaceae bacterium]
MAADVGEEELEAVGRAGDGDGRHRSLVLLLLLILLVSLVRLFGDDGRSRAPGLSGIRLADLEPKAFELAGQLLDFLLVEVLLDGERLDRGGFDVAALLGALDDGPDLIRLEQFLQLVLSQGPLRPFNERRKMSALTIGAESSARY